MPDSTGMLTLYQTGGARCCDLASTSHVHCLHA